MPAIRVIMMPKDTNALGTIFGGIILSYIDQAGAVEAHRHSAAGRYVTVAMREVEFPLGLGKLERFVEETRELLEARVRHAGALELAGLCDRQRPSVLTDVDEDHFGFGDLDLGATGMAALGLDEDVHRDRGVADAERAGEEADQVADEDRGVKYDFAHRDGDDAARTGAMRFDRARLVDVGEDHAAEDGAQGVGVLRHHDDADRGHLPEGQVVRRGFAHSARCYRSAFAGRGSSGAPAHVLAGDKDVTQFQQYSAIGSGSYYALGALRVLYDQPLSAEQIGRRAVQVGIDLDVCCGRRIDCQTIG
jgi:acyl-CoA thioesterase YciA